MIRLPIPALALLVTSGCVAPTDELQLPELMLEAPAVLDLGWITTGEPFEGQWRIENTGESVVAFESLQPLGAQPQGLQIDARALDDLIEPGQAVTVLVRLVADPQAPDTISVPLGLSISGVAAGDPRLPVVELRARVSRSGLIAEPNPLTIGPVLYLQTQTGTLAVRNLRTTPVELFALRHASGRAQYEEAVTRGEFGPLPQVDGIGRITTLGPGEAHTIAIDYTAPGGPGEAKEQAVWRVGTCIGDDACALDLIVQGLPDHEAPRAQISPAGVHFGPVSVGASVERPLSIKNNGLRALEISNVRFMGNSEFEAALPASVKLDPGGEHIFTLRYAPADVSLDNAELTFNTNDPLNRVVQVRVTGSGVVLPPCRVEVQPPVLNFGTVEIFENLTQVAVVLSVGEEPCVAFDPQIHLAAGTDPLTFFFDVPPPASVTLSPNTTATYSVTYAPIRPGPHAGTLVLKTGPEETIEIPLRGATPAGQNIVCSSDLTVDLESTVTLGAVLGQGSTAQRYDWQLLSGPMQGGAIAATLDHNGPQAEFIPHLLGTYVVAVEVETTSGALHTCQTQIVSKSAGFKTTLTWDGEGDLDLHLHRGANAPWFGPADCHFDNLDPTWVASQPTGSGPNPRHSGDDTSGDGPEEIFVAEPELGVPYTIAVGHFERAQGRTARVQIFCGRATAELDLTSRVFSGAQTGACTNNDFWTVATITFSAPAQCAVQLEDTYRSSAQACESFQ